jgi:hypothetical protein
VIPFLLFFLGVPWACVYTIWLDNFENSLFHIFRQGGFVYNHGCRYCHLLRLHSHYIGFWYIFSLVGNELTKCALVFYFMNGDKYLVVSFACLKNFVNYRPKLSHFNDLRQSHGLVLLTQWSEDLHGNLPQLLLVGIIW